MTIIRHLICLFCACYVATAIAWAVAFSFDPDIAPRQTVLVGAFYALVGIVLASPALFLVYFPLSLRAWREGKGLAWFLLLGTLAGMVYGITVIEMMSGFTAQPAALAFGVAVFSPPAFATALLHWLLLKAFERIGTEKKRLRAAIAMLAATVAAGGIFVYIAGSGGTSTQQAVSGDAIPFPPGMTFEQAQPIGKEAPPARGQPPEAGPEAKVPSIR